MFLCFCVSKRAATHIQKKHEKNGLADCFDRGWNVFRHLGFIDTIAIDLDRLGYCGRNMLCIDGPIDSSIACVVIVVVFDLFKV
jgi:hypothetical protein